MTKYVSNQIVENKGIALHANTMKLLGAINRIFLPVPYVTRHRNPLTENFRRTQEKGRRFYPLALVVVVTPLIWANLISFLSLALAFPFSFSREKRKKETQFLSLYRTQSTPLFLFCAELLRTPVVILQPSLPPLLLPKKNTGKKNFVNAK